MIATSLFAATGTSMSITGYFVLIALISLMSILLLRVPSAGTNTEQKQSPSQEGV